jgi:hypothetical protein
MKWLHLYDTSQKQPLVLRLRLREDADETTIRNAAHWLLTQVEHSELYEFTVITEQTLYEGRARLDTAEKPPEATP